MPRTSDVGEDVVIRVQDVRKSFVLRHTHSLKETFVAFTRRKTLSSSFTALKGVTFDVRKGESVALLGFNGSGKSTLLKLLSGVLRPDAGEIGIRGRLAGLIEVGGGFHPDLTGRENVFLNAAILGMTETETEARYDQIVEFSEISDFMDTEVKYYSSGMFVRLAFAVAIHVKCDILLIDEILAVGDEPFQRKCFAKIDEMKAAGTTIVLVTHDLDAAKRLCERGIVLNQHEVVFDGPSVDAVKALRAA